jgi:hypothetical protein
VKWSEFRSFPIVASLTEAKLQKGRHASGRSKFDLQGSNLQLGSFTVASNTIPPPFSTPPNVNLPLGQPGFSG